MNDNFRRYVTLSLSKRQLEDQISAIKTELKTLEEPLLEELLEEGVRSIKLDSGTVYMHKQKWARVVPSNGDGKTTQADRVRALEALESIGLREQFAALNHQSLSAWAREQDLPPELDGIIRVDEEISLRVRKS